MLELYRDVFWKSPIAVTSPLIQYLVHVKTFLETIAGFAMTAVIFIALAIVSGLIGGDTSEELAPFFGWGLALLAVSLLVYWLSKSVASPSPRAGVASAGPGSQSTSDGEDLVAKENNRKVAAELASGHGMLAVNARLWLKAYDKDSSVPIFGVRPYWTPTGPGGSPQLLSTIGLASVEARLDYVRETTADDTLLAVMASDPNPRVRDAAAARL